MSYQGLLFKPKVTKIFHAFTLTHSNCFHCLIEVLLTFFSLETWHNCQSLCTLPVPTSALIYMTHLSTANLCSSHLDLHEPVNLFQLVNEWSHLLHCVITSKVLFKIFHILFVIVCCQITLYFVTLFLTGTSKVKFFLWRGSFITLF